MKSIRTLGNILLVTTALLGTYHAQEEQSQIIDGIAAIVNDNLVLKSDVSQLVGMAALRRNLDPVQDRDALLKMQEEILQSLIDQKIILEMAKLDSVEVEEKEVNQALDQQMESFVANAGSEARAEELLGQSLKSFRREFWSDMKDRLITEKYQQQLMSSITISKKEVMDFFKTYRDSISDFPTMVKLRHLLVPVKPGERSRRKALAKLDSIRQRILAGEPFEDLAERYSQDPGSSQNGGSLGLVRRGSLVPEFESVAFTLPAGEISTPVESPFGYHLIQTQEKMGDKIRVRHILITPQITEEDESRAYSYALSLKDSAETLDDFIALVKRYSEDEKTKDIGGDLGWINPKNSPIPEIAQVVNLLELNQCSRPVRSSFGYHLFWLEGVKPGGKPNLKDHWPEIEAMALNQKRMEWYSKWISDARERIFIQIPQ
jgi:peptidyl-prolyl cis-trans isomerase SurA